MKYTVTSTVYRDREIWYRGIPWVPWVPPIPSCNYVCHSALHGPKMPSPVRPGKTSARPGPLRWLQIWARPGPARPGPVNKKPGTARPGLAHQRHWCLNCCICQSPNTVVTWEIKYEIYFSLRRCADWNNLLFQNNVRGLLQLMNIFQHVQCRWNNFEII